MKKLTKPTMIITLFIILTNTAFAQAENAFSKISFTLDIIQIIIGLFSVYLAWNVLKGKIGSGLKIISIGIAIFGVFHLIETLLYLTNIYVDTNEIIHRLLGMIAFTFILIGLYKIKKSISQTQ